MRGTACFQGCGPDASCLAPTLQSCFVFGRTKGKCLLALIYAVYTKYRRCRSPEKPEDSMRPVQMSPCCYGSSQPIKMALQQNCSLI